MRIRDLARRLTARIRSLPTPAVDAGLAIIFLGAVVTERLRNPLPLGLLSVVAAILTLALAISLALRRRVPFTAFAIATAALCTGSLLHVPSVFSPLANQICVYSVGAYASRARARWAVPVIVAGVLLYFAGTPGLDQLDAEMVEVLLVWLATWAVGYTVARRREEQDRARLATARQVVAEERVRISRELHDLMGHTVNLLVVQAGAARLMLEKDPAMTRELLSGMERTGRETLADLDQVLATLRPDRGRAGGGGRVESSAGGGPAAGARGPIHRLRYRRHAVGRADTAATPQRGPVDLPDRPRRAYEHAQARRSVRGDR